MELWVKIGRSKKKLQGSFRDVMERLLEESKGKKTVQLLSFHAGQKERRRFKRELRANGKDLVKTATAVVRWFYLRDARALRRRIKELKKRARYLSKGEVLYCSGTLERARALEEELKRVESRLEELKAG